MQEPNEPVRPLLLTNWESGTVEEPVLTSIAYDEQRQVWLTTEGTTTDFGGVHYKATYDDTVTQGGKDTKGDPRDDE